MVEMWGGVKMAEKRKEEELEQLREAAARCRIKSARELDDRLKVVTEAEALPAKTEIQIFGQKLLPWVRRRGNSWYV